MFYSPDRTDPIPPLLPYTTLFRSEERQRQHIHLGMTEEPEQVLPQYRPTIGRVINPPTERAVVEHPQRRRREQREDQQDQQDRKSTRLNSSHVAISYAVDCWTKKK